MSRGKCRERNEFVVKHFGLVNHLLNRYQIPDRHREAAFQEGCLGLILAADRFKPEAGKFSTFAFFYIKQRLIRFIVENYRFETAPMPGVRERFTVQSLSQPVGSDEDTGITLEDTVEDSCGSPEEMVCNKDSCELVRSLLQQISKDLHNESVVAIIERRLLNQFPRKLKDLSYELGVPTVKLKDLEQKIMRRLRRKVIKLEEKSVAYLR